MNPPKELEKFPFGGDMIAERIGLRRAAGRLSSENPPQKKVGPAVIINHFQTSKTFFPLP
jgi:hypothetical protein